MRLSQYSFVVPREKSSYSIVNRRVHDTVRYDGTFLVDPKTFGLVRLTVHASELPVELHACEDTTTLDYGTFRLNEAEFLLPTMVRLQVDNTDGSQFGITGQSFRDVMNSTGNQKWI